MPSEYLVPGDYALYGVAQDATQQDVQAASAVIDGWLHRPAGCVYTVVNSVPTAMAATGSPIVETWGAPRSPIVETWGAPRSEMILSYWPLAVVQKAEQLQSGAWVTLSGWLAYDSGSASILDLTATTTYAKAPLRVTYLAGWPYSALPVAIKQACANLLNQPADPAIPLNIARVRAGDTEIQRQLNTPWDPKTQVQLRPYVRVFA